MLLTVESERSKIIRMTASCNKRGSIKQAKTDDCNNRDDNQAFLCYYYGSEYTQNLCQKLNNNYSTIGRRFYRHSI